MIQTSFALHVCDSVGILVEMQLRFEVIKFSYSHWEMEGPENCTKYAWDKGSPQLTLYLEVGYKPERKKISSYFLMSIFQMVRTLLKVLYTTGLSLNSILHF